MVLHLDFLGLTWGHGRRSPSSGTVAVRLYISEWSQLRSYYLSVPLKVHLHRVSKTKAYLLVSLVLALTNHVTEMTVP